MIPVFDALEAALAGVAVGGVHLLQNNDAAPKLPYLLVEPVNMDPFFEASLRSDDGAEVVRVRLKGVGANPTSALIVLRNARTALVGGKKYGTLTVNGGSASVQYVRHEADFGDPQTLIPGTTKPMCLSVDSYTVFDQ